MSRPIAYFITSFVQVLGFIQTSFFKHTQMVCVHAHIDTLVIVHSIAMNTKASSSCRTRPFTRPHLNIFLRNKCLKKKQVLTWQHSLSVPFAVITSLPVLNDLICIPHFSFALSPSVTLTYSRHSHTHLSQIQLLDNKKSRVINICYEESILFLLLWCNVLSLSASLIYCCVCNSVQQWLMLFGLNEAAINW